MLKYNIAIIIITLLLCEKYMKFKVNTDEPERDAWAHTHTQQHTQNVFPTSFYCRALWIIRHSECVNESMKERSTNEVIAPSPKSTALIGWETVKNTNELWVRRLVGKTQLAQLSSLTYCQAGKNKNKIEIMLWIKRWAEAGVELDLKLCAFFFTLTLRALQVLVMLMHRLEVTGPGPRLNKEIHLPQLKGSNLGVSNHL